MPGRSFLATGVVAVLTFGAAAVAQDATVPPPGPAPVSTPPPAMQPSFPVGAEVLSVDGEVLGVLAHVETGATGEQTLHVRIPDGQIRPAPAKLASRGERAVVLEWTRAQFEAPEAAAAPPPTL